MPTRLPPALPSNSSDPSRRFSFPSLSRRFCGLASHFLPIGRPGYIAVQHTEHLRVAGGEILVGRVPLLAALPARLRQPHETIFRAFTFLICQMETRTGIRGVWENTGVNDEFRSRAERLGDGRSGQRSGSTL